jgi:hypothetical protein
MPVYVDYDSADVWANQSLFQLDKDTALPKAVAGKVPLENEKQHSRLYLFLVQVLLPILTAKSDSCGTIREL